MSLAMLGLAATQFYWVRYALLLKSEQFDYNVTEALQATVRSIDKAQTSEALLQRIAQQADSGNQTVFNSHQTEILYEQYEDTQKTVRTAAIQMKIKNDSVQPLQLEQLLQEKNKLLNEIIGNLFNKDLPLYQRIDTNLLQQTLQKNLIERNIHTNFVMGIQTMPEKEMVFVSPLQQSYFLDKNAYETTLFPDDFWGKKYKLSVAFPQKNRQLIEDISGMLGLSLLLMLVVIAAFAYTIRTINKQKKLSEMKDDFVSNITHEFKTPISTISLACEMLQNEPIITDKQKAQRYVGMVKQENVRLQKMVEKLLETALIDADRVQLKWQIINVKDVITQVVALFELQAEKNQVQFRQQIDKEPLLIEGDNFHFTNIIFNLIDNAIKYSSSNPIVAIQVTATQKHIHIRIKDNGIGISKEAQKYIFDKFYRVPQGNIHNVKGYGLGLNYVKHMTELHKGSITLSSEIGKGTTFELIFPKKENE
jgi:two-component system phosphate regulon sensor histidine kinase PhoR